MTQYSTWHADQEMLAGYAAGTLSRSQAASVESHLTSCGSCRASMGPLASSERLARNLAAIVDSVDQPRQHRLEAALVRVGVPEHFARVLMVSPSERGPRVVGVLVALLVAIAAEAFSGSGGALFVLLVAAPLLPLAGVAAAATFRHDPAREILAAVPTRGFSVFLMRALAVVAPTIVVALGAALLVPGQGWETVLWLLPSFGLMAMTLALGSWLPIRAVAWTLGVAWVLAAAIAAQGATAADWVGSYAAFQLAGQVALLVVTLLAGVVVAVRRDSFDLIELGRTS
jgi:Putative zinc-finger